MSEFEMTRVLQGEPEGLTVGGYGSRGVPGDTMRLLNPCRKILLRCSICCCCEGGGVHVWRRAVVSS
ncbi:hypothetical protein BC835DRAFT_1372910 [Cytidiella melzeri]|nr:hypothetical protein BC835DRAFT_1372910 [Cytidiella melzeri]